MSGLLLDTVAVSAMRAPHRQPARVQSWLSNLDLTACFISALTWMEIETGILKRRRTDRPQADLIDGWFRTARIQFRWRTVPFDSAAAQAAAPLWLMRSRGTVDTLIAATALAGGFNLVTRNTRDFADIPGLTLINPWE